MASSLLVNVIGVGLVVIGVVLIFVTVAFWRSAVEDPDVLAPLEVMGDRRFARADDERRIEYLNDARPAGAETVSASAAPPVLVREPVSEPVRPFRDPFPHDDDAVDVVDRPRPVVPDIIDPLLSQRRPVADTADDPDSL